MKKWIAVLMMTVLAVPALAQFAGLPIAGGAAAAPGGAFSASGGVVIGDDVNLYGVRGGFAPIEGLALFGDAGVLDPDEGDMGWAVQGGGLFTLPLELPVDVGVRGTLGFAGYDGDGGDVTYMDIMGGLLVSKAIQQLTPYAFLGFNYMDYEVELDGYHGDYSDDETDAVLAAGVEFAINEQISLYGEIAHIDDPFFGFGGRARF